ncbi:hypothetical protein M5689_002548 [Euphorbia peplus]|nr:hypothetical protein M5689_002548 [Euphorbia peplus]
MASRIESCKATFSFCFFIFQVLIIWSSICYLIRISLTPRIPHYTMTSIHLLPLLSNKTSNASLILQLEIFNPNNGISIFSEDIRIILHENDSIVAKNVSGNMSCCFPGVSVSDKNTAEEEFPCSIGNQSLPGFHQGYKGNSTFNVTVNLTEIFRNPGEDQNTKDMKIRISFITWVKFKYRIFKTVTDKRLIEMEAYVPVALDGRKMENLRIKLHSIVKGKS